jgi:hypothetical protein
MKNARICGHFFVLVTHQFIDDSSSGHDVSTFGPPFRFGRSVQSRKCPHRAGIFSGAG